MPSMIVFEIAVPNNFTTITDYLNFFLPLYLSQDFNELISPPSGRDCKGSNLFQYAKFLIEIF